MHNIAIFTNNRLSQDYYQLLVGLDRIVTDRVMAGRDVQWEMTSQVCNMMVHIVEPTFV